MSKQTRIISLQESLRDDSSGINNVGLVARALLLKSNPTLDEEENVRWQTLQVSAMSIASCFGRILIGFCPSLGYNNIHNVQTFCPTGATADLAKHKGMRRAQFISIVAASFLVSQLVGLQVQDIEHLQYAVILVGISYGATFGLLPIIIIEWFGMGPYTLASFPLGSQELTSLRIPYSDRRAAHVSENSGYFALSPLVMGNVLSITFGRILDAHSTYSEYGMRCLEGAQCYSESLYLSASACFCALILGCMAAKRDQKYK